MTAVQEVQLYRTSDGAVFEDQAEAQEHQTYVSNKLAIDAFIDKHFPIPAPEVTIVDGKEVKKSKQNAGRGPARKALSLWLAEQAA